MSVNMSNVYDSVSNYTNSIGCVYANRLLVDSTSIHIIKEIYYTGLLT